MIPETENTSRQKAALEQNSIKHREAFEHELADIMDRTKRVATTAAVVGGGFAISYYIIKKITGGKKTVKRTISSDGNKEVNEVVIHKQPSTMTTIGNVILTEVAIFMLGMAKEKLKVLLDKRNPEDEYSEQTQ